jgi:SAM-dependent methyltransferase
MDNVEKQLSEKPVPTFNPDYHRRQWDTCYESTKAFLDFLERNKAVSKRDENSVIDLCCGSGANLFWMKKQFPNISLTGFDVIPELVDFGNQELKAREVTNAKLLHGDVYALDAHEYEQPDGVIALQTVSWLPDEVGFVETAASFQPEWIAITGLMIPGSRSFRCLVNNDEDPTNNVNYYNTFSIPYLESLFEEHGYGDFVFEPFHIGIDIEKPEDASSGTYTEMKPDGTRLQISGAILMNWYFMIAYKQP